MLPYLFVGVLVVSKVLGGQFTRLTRLKIRDGYWLLGALAVQLGAILFRPQAPTLGAILFIFSYLGLIAFCLRNRHICGMALILAGICLNFVVIGLNGGSMPISAQTLQTIGRGQRLETPAVQVGVPATQAPAQLVKVSKDAVNEMPTLALLGDVIVLPFPGQFATAISFGDVLIFLGISWLILKTMQITAFSKLDWKAFAR